ncbi:hypothetical protein [Peribacillus glennii]|uniref:Uncharacterized protein n=1 Tax=Peribacillus glennii TaxID=2303991 RepID=A0A372LBJ1_9BACI|nr:hypothetical protein [Peribacillus glennii]RFU62937.1 hypothetical protein D0466_13390 [Peribacillus glennii]
MDVRLLFFAILSGFALVLLPGLEMSGTMDSIVSAVSPITTAIGVIDIFVLSLYMIWSGFKSLFK